MFSIIIPTFNNLNYLKICIESIEKNSNFDHDKIIHINEGTDGSLEYIKQKELTLRIGEKERKYLKNLLLATTSRNLWGNNIYYKILSKEDKYIEKGINIFNRTFNDRQPNIFFF